MNIKIILLLSLIIILALNYKRVLSFINYIQEQNVIQFKKRTNLDLNTLTRISARPVMILYGLEYFFLNRAVFYFDDVFLYKITRKDPVVKHKLSEIYEVKRTLTSINKRRVWKIIINNLGQQTEYKIRSNYGQFDLFLDKIKENPNTTVDSKYVWGIFE